MERLLRWLDPSARPVLVQLPEAEYRTRVVVRRPAAAEDFSGTVLVEWFNVSAIEAAPDWGYLSQEIGREGHVYIGVSAQCQGVEGGETILDVEVDPDAREVRIGPGCWALLKPRVKSRREASRSTEFQ